MSTKSKIIISIVIIGGLFWLASQLHQSCADLDHARLDQMDSATKEFYFTNCR